MDGENSSADVFPAGLVRGALGFGPGPDSVPGGVGLDAPPAVYGSCAQARVHFTGRINASAPGTVSYQWIRSDQRPQPVRVLKFARPGPITVSYDWAVRGNFSGWAAIRVVAPVEAESRKVGFRVDCGNSTSTGPA